jgi:hypothetical protein
MSPEAPVSKPRSARPSFAAGRVRQASLKAMLIRFVVGAVTSIAAGGVDLIWGARAAGVLLAFPAILAASLTLIEKQEDSDEARDDSRGAVLGGCGLAVFAAVAALTLTHVGWVFALLLAAAAWTMSVLVLYVVAWWH